MYRFVRKMKYFCIILLVFTHASYAAGWKSSGYLIENYTRSDNGVTYVYLKNYTGNCLYKRIEIADDKPYSEIYASRLYSMLLSAIAQKKEVKYTWWEPDSPKKCVLNSLSVKWN